MDLAILDNVGHQRGAMERPRGLDSPASGRSLTLHRTGCLRGGTSVGLEPTGCPTSRVTAEHGGELQARAEDLELLKAIAASKVFTEFERAFTEATGLCLELQPVESFRLSCHDHKRGGSFCVLMARENRSCGACLQSQSQVAQAGKENPHTGVCYAGLCETVVPLRLGSRLLGYLRTGQVFRGKPSEQQFQRTLKLLTSWGIKLREGELRGAYFGTPVVSREQHAAAVKLLAIFADHLAILSNQILIQRRNAEPPMITKAKDFIREHHAEGLSLAQVARFANTSPFYFCKLFKQATGLTFTNFVSHVRIESSKNLLSNPQLRVSEIAFEVGFQSLTHFNRVFHKILGQSPTEYRLKVQNGRNQFTGE